MASLSHDLWLLLLACALVGGYMRLYFRCARMAALATAQLLLSFPLLYWCVCVLGGVQKLSAFSAASLWVGVGVSAPCAARAVARGGRILTRGAG